MTESESSRLIAETLRIHEAEERGGAALDAAQGRDKSAFLAARQIAIDACDARIDHTHHAAYRLARMLEVAMDMMRRCSAGEIAVDRCWDEEADDALAEIEKIAKGES